MDFVTHTVAGLVVGRVAVRTPGRASLLAGALAALAPDADILVWATGGLDAYLEHRGGVTHGVVGLAIGPLLIAALLTRFGQPLRRAWWVCLLAWGSHLALDALTARGIAPLAPFHEVRLALAWVYPLDLTLLGLLTLPLWVPQAVSAPPRRMGAIAGLAALAWVAGCGALHAAAVARFEATLAEQGVTVQRVRVVPAAFLPLWWTGAAWDGHVWHVAAVTPHRDAVLRGRLAPNHDHPATRAVLEDPAGRRFLRFATAPVAEVRCRPGGYVVLLRDALSGDPWSGVPPPPEVFELEVKRESLSIRDQYWATWLSGRQPPAAACADNPAS